MQIPWANTTAERIMKYVFRSLMILDVKTEILGSDDEADGEVQRCPTAVDDSMCDKEDVAYTIVQTVTMHGRTLYRAAH